MKKNLYYFLTAAFVLAAVSCQKSDIDENNTAEAPKDDALVPVTLTCVSEQTKTLLDPESGNIYWEAGDHISVFDGAGNQEFEISIEEGQNPSLKANFSGNASSSATSLVTLYPYDADAQYYEGMVNTALPYEYTVVPGTFTDNTNVAVGLTTGSETVTFRNVGSLLKFTLSKADTHKSVTIKTADAAIIAGGISVNPETAIAQPTAEGVSEVVLSASKGYLEAGTYYVVVLPQTGKKVVFVFSDGVSETTVTASDAIDWPRSEVVNYKTIDGDVAYPETTFTEDLTTSIVGSLAVDEGDEFKFSVEASDDYSSYEWLVPSQLKIVSGQGTNEVTVKVVATQTMIEKGSVRLFTTTSDAVTCHTFLWDIVVLPIDNYHTAKRYGDKVWMTVNLNYAGKEGNTGKTHPDDRDGTLYGRYYTWAEAMTGSSTATNPYAYESTGTDDMGAEYTLNNSATDYNVQIQGICPKGWHVPNAYDYCDLITGVANDYNLWNTSCEACYTNGEGIYFGKFRGSLSGGVTYTGMIGSYLRGSSPAADGGLWNNHANQQEDGKVKITISNTTYYVPMYLDTDNKIGFDILPCGKYASTTATSVSEFGTYSFHWLATIDSNSKNCRITLANSNANFSTYFESGSRNQIRCVANYDPAYKPSYNVNPTAE